MKCGEVEKLLPDYVSGDISASQRRLIEEHLSRCTRCRKALAAYNEAKQYLTSLKDSPVPPEFTKATMKKVRAATNSRTQRWLRPVLAAGAAVVIVLAVLLAVQLWGLGSQSGIGGTMMPPPLSHIIVTDVMFLALLGGILMMLGLAFGNRLARGAAGGASILFGIIGIYVGLHALLVDTSDLFLVVGIIPIFGLIMGIVAIKRHASHQWAAIIGMVLCCSALVLDTIFVITYPAPRIWIIIATVALPVSIITYAFHHEIKQFPRKWLRPALAAGAAVVILAILLVTQPWGVSPQSVMARACAATEGLQSYRMSSYTTSIFNGETKEQTYEMAFAAPDRYHVRATIDDERHELIIISDRLYRYQPDEPEGPQSSQVSVAVSPGSLLSKEYTLQILDNLANLETLPDGEIEGVECLHYRGRVDMERMIEEQTASLDPEQPGYEEMVKAMEQTREQAHQMKIEVELWIGKDDYLIRQMVQTTRFPDSEGQLQTSSTTLTFYDFNQPIAIEPPLDASGQLLTGWQLAGSITPDSKQPVLGRSITSSIGAQEGYNDWAHQEVKYSITITNNSVETVKNVRLTITTMLTDEANKPATVEAEPETSADIIASGESRTYHAHCPFDASDYTKEDILELQDVTTILVHFTTEGGQELTELLFPDAPYPTKTPPEGPPD